MTGPASVRRVDLEQLSSQAGLGPLFVPTCVSHERPWSGPSTRATCPHQDTQPVDVRNHTTGSTETVARICLACLTQLPAAWGCDDCEWAEQRRLCDIRPTLILTAPCQEHA